MAQKNFTLETLSADEFEPDQHFVSIVGLRIDPKGDVVGWAANHSRKLGFYWPVGKSYIPLTFDQIDCEPRGLDSNGVAYLWCNGLQMLFKPGVRPVDLHLTANQLADFRGAGGDSWGVGFSNSSRYFTGSRVGTRNMKLIAVEPLLPAAGHRSSLAVAVNSSGVATGSSSFVSANGFVGEDISNRLGRAAIWEKGAKVPSLIEPHRTESWVPQIGRAINDDGVVVGSTSPYAFSPPNGCYPATPSADLYSTRAFVSEPILLWRDTRLLQGVDGDDTVTTMLATGINAKRVIVGVRNGVDCGPKPVLLSGVHALRWKDDNGNWTRAETLRSLFKPSGSEVTCARDIFFHEAHAINDDGAITGSGSCADRLGKAHVFAYRLTPVY